MLRDTQNFDIIILDLLRIELEIGKQHLTRVCCHVDLFIKMGALLFEGDLF